MNKIEEFQGNKVITTITETTREHEHRQEDEARRYENAVRMAGVLRLLIPTLNAISPEGYFRIAMNAVQKFEKR